MQCAFPVTGYAFANFQKIGGRHQIGAVKSGQEIGVLPCNLEPVTDFRVMCRMKLGKA
jgi:hypothetical protein